MASPARLCNRIREVGTNKRLDLSFSLRTHLKDHTRYGQRGPGIHGNPKRVSFLVSKALPARCLKVWMGGPLEWDAGI